MESREARCKRFLESPVNEIPLTLANSLNSFFRPELEQALAARHFGLFMLGSHSVVQIVARHILRLKPRDGTQRFLEMYVDGHSEDLRFSKVADTLHGYRNILAHQWFSARGHDLREDWDVPTGWAMDGDTVVLNPGIYGARFLTCFSQLHSIIGVVPRETLLRAKFEFLVDWLEVGRGDPLRKDLRDFVSLPDTELDAGVERMTESIRSRSAANA